MSAANDALGYIGDRKKFWSLQLDTEEKEKKRRQQRQKATTWEGMKKAEGNRQ